MKHYPFHPPVYYCRKAHAPLTLDGRLDKPFWADIPFTEPFVDIEGPEKGKTPIGTGMPTLTPTMPPSVRRANSRAI